MFGVSVAALRGGAVTVEDVDWSVAPGEFWVVAGPEHSGKSDLLMLAAGLTSPVAGRSQLFGQDLSDLGGGDPAARRRAGFVFQGGHLFNRLTVAENVALPLQYGRNLSLAEAAPEVQALLERLELTPLADVQPARLAPHWRQRAALARALILRPELLLLDNPLSGLGARQAQWWLRVLDRLADGDGLPGGLPMTLVVAADDLRPWRHSRRQYSLLRDRRFIPLGGWSGVESAADPVVKELLAIPLETTL
jgi:ABC-type transporter Mla maintaining outer membrane lipid asymmetry ATPase subunit MlaF